MLNDVIPNANQIAKQCALLEYHHLVQAPSFNFFDLPTDALLTNKNSQ